MGDTLSIEGYTGLDFTLISWQESNHVVNGPYDSDYYTFFAQPGMKFISVQYRITNTGVNDANVPSLSEGSLVVGSQTTPIQVWVPLMGIETEEYTPRASTTDEIRLLGGHDIAYEHLLPGQSVTGRIVFEIPGNAMPVEAQLVVLPLSISFSDGGTMVTAGHGATPPNFKVAFIGDADLGRDAVAVLELIRDEGADMVLRQGDFDHRNSPRLWDLQINSGLGPDFAYFGSVGNHDIEQLETLKEYQAVLLDRLSRIKGASCIGEMAVQSACWYKGLFFILLGNIGHENSIRKQLASNDSIWRICSWHDNQSLMQTSGKKFEMGWGPYEACREGGAIIATGHIHSYARTHLMDNFETQSIVSDSNTLELEKGKSFVFVSGLGGHSIHGEDDEYAANPWWADVYSSTNRAWRSGANFWALFCTFNYKEVESRAHCYFKDIDGRIADDFF